MVTYFNKKDLVSFGNYLLSDERKQLFQQAFDMQIISGVENPTPVDEELKNVHHSDLYNWIEKQNK